MASGGIVRLGDANTGGGLVMASGCDPTVLVNGRPIAIALGGVTPHPPCPKAGIHCTAKLQIKPSAILVNGKPVAVWPSVDSCGHTRVSGSFDVVIGG